MSLIADVFAGQAFSAVELTRSIQVVPNMYGRLNELGLMPAEPIPTTQVAVTYENGTLNLLPTTPRGAPPTLGQNARRNMRVFQIPHIPHEDRVTAADVQDRMGYRGSAGLDSVIDFVNRKLITMRNKHAITLEHLRMGALKGVILDADGSTLIDLFSEFGVTPKVVSFALGTDATDVDAKILEVVRHIEDNLLGEVMTGVHALCSAPFFDGLISHPNIRDAYKFYATTQSPLQKDVRQMFTHKGVTFEEYRGKATQLNADGTTTVRPFIPDGDARFFPVGTMDTFSTYFAPADIIGEENVAPETEVYVAQAIDQKFQRWVDLHSQSNPLPMCKRPSLLVRGTVA